MALVADEQATQWFHPAPEDEQPRAAVDTGVAHIARVYNYWLGGKDNFAADREAAEVVITSYPTVLTSVRAQRQFLRRAVGYLAGQAGIRQFIDIGTGLPSAGNTHEVAQQVAPQSRIVYVDNDPIVLAHALLASSPQGATAYLDADFRNTDAILAEAAALVDFSEPVAVMLIGLLHCVPDADDPVGIVNRILAAVPSGSYLVIAHPASDIHPEQIGTAANQLNQVMAEPVTLRTRDEVARFFDGLDLLEPGLVQLHRWRATPADPGAELANYGGVARKP
jgi:hypothetical protein